MSIETFEDIGPASNVRIGTYLNGVLVEERVVHNILTNNGRKWLRDLVGALDYTATAGSGFIEGAGNVTTSERVRYIGLGVGGLLTSDPAVFNGTQEETVTVTAIEDYVKINGTDYLREVLPQNSPATLPTNFSIRFITTLLETDVSFAGNVSKSGQAVGTLVKVSEAGLYLSGASATDTPDHGDNTPRLIAYNIFEPISINPNVVVRLEWELRF